MPQSQSAGKKIEAASAQRWITGSLLLPNSDPFAAGFSHVDKAAQGVKGITGNIGKPAKRSYWRQTLLQFQVRQDSFVHKSCSSVDRKSFCDAALQEREKLHIPKLSLLSQGTCCPPSSSPRTWFCSEEASPVDKMCSQVPSILHNQDPS